MTNRKNRLNAWDRIMAAITFAEAGEQETAREIMNQETPEERAREIREPKIEQRKRVRPELRL